MRVPDAPSVPAAALLPLRAFLGGMFAYAGFDKLVDPRFLDPSSAASIQAQMAAFVRVSPIGGLVRLGQPAAVPIGLAIAFVEIAIGIGALTGLAFRAAAWGGAALAGLFFLSASWSTHPLYYGPDLPYAAGWITLALTGHGGVAISRRLIDSVRRSPTVEASRRPGDGRRGRALNRRAAGAPVDPTTPLRDRRTVLELGLLGALALVAASVSLPFRARTATGSRSGDLDAEPSDASSPVAAGGGPSASAAVASTGATGAVVATAAQVGVTGARAFTVPFTAPAPLPAGDPAVVVKLADGTYVAFDAVCTHAGCRVEWDSADRLLVCPCHGAAFDPEHGASVLAGPTAEPLAAIPIVVDATTGTISLRT